MWCFYDLEAIVNATSVFHIAIGTFNALAEHCIILKQLRKSWPP